MRIVIMTAVEAERDAVLHGLRGAGGHQPEVHAVGVGPASAAAGAASILAAGEYDLAVSAGIGGGFPGVAEVGTIVVASEVVAADLGAETPDGFVSVDELGFGTSRLPADPDLVARVTAVLGAARLPVVTGPVLTVSTVTGTKETAIRRAEQVPGAAAEGMEGYGVAVAARKRGVPVLEIRTISNLVGPRDRNSWQIEKALNLLEKTGSLLKEMFA